MFNPVSTYRVQFHKGFSFADFVAIVPYLQELGIKTVYASPIFEAVPGSTHGYDAVNPLVINPEIGTIEQLKDISRQLKEAGIGWVQDIVPNHMAYHKDNRWLLDVLEKGQQSHYASFFDITWNTGLFKGRLMVPFLGASLDEVIKNGELRLGYEDGRFCLKYYESFYPLHLRSYLAILSAAEPNDAINTVLAQLNDLHGTEEKEAFAKGWDELLLQLGSLLKNETVARSVQAAMDAVNSDPKRIRELADDQDYRLCHWQETDHQINYRRFFTVNGLICLNVQDETVLAEHHALVKTLIGEGVFQGLRVDHIDGLYNPTEYLHRLRSLAGDDAYIVVEKILEPGEELLTHWPVQGTTGYDFISHVNNLFTNKDAEEAFTQYYQELTDDYRSIHQHLHDKKSHILQEHMGGELENLYRLLLQLNIADKRQLARIPSDDLKSAIGEFLVQCPVYRFYGSRFPLSGEEEAAVRAIFHRLRRSGESRDAVAVLETIFLQKPHGATEEVTSRIAQFYQRCMQFTGPLMAKGVEDTLMYTYNRFIGHNEVGDSPEAFGYTPAEFHEKMAARQKQWGLAMSGTATHDTKRGEDVRARLNVLTDIPARWLAVVDEWRQLNSDLKTDGAPDANDEYFIYQTLVGHYQQAPSRLPQGGGFQAQPSLIEDTEQNTASSQSGPRSEAQIPPPWGREEGAAGFAERLSAYLEKALREAKRHSNWTTPNVEYETAAKNFALGLLNQERPFWKSFTAFLQEIREHGMINALSQVLLKFTLPGMPDLYQGCELWDFSFVDPDNRRPVDYGLRQQLLQRFDAGGEALLRELWKEDDGGIKLWLTQQLLAMRRTDSGLFAEGDYIPLTVEGKHRQHVFAFARRQGERTYLFAVPLHTAALCGEGKSFFEIDWEDTRIVLPKEFSGFSDVLSGKTIAKAEGLLAKNLFRKFTVAMLQGRQTAKQRSAGILLHITSLPSAFAVGDLGTGARRFADFLHRSGQKHWQLLPLNPTEEGQGFSPYSALSSKAGWPLLLSPEALAKEGLLSPEAVDAARTAGSDSVDYREAIAAKDALLDAAFETFAKTEGTSLHNAFELFCEKERGWLQDFALFMALKQSHGGAPWFQWPDELMHRDEDALQKVAKEKATELRKIKWLQFLFSRQWAELKTYCNNRNIRFIGDMPFYVSYDSADVWAAQHLFSVDEDGKQTGMAGVPPDAFSADGQLWGMPTFNWERMKESGYDWWIQRLRKNMELFDLTRLDHFRAFEAYWEVPAGETTARNGRWIKGPGEDFFKAMQREFGELPFVAEDLGDINEAVLALRDEAALPGMKVLQFAFGEDLPQSGYIPHNYERNFLVYSGTHDNNTTAGWWKTETNAALRQRVKDYAGTDVHEGNVHTVFQRLAYGSVADVAILPMQDILGLDERGRMNVPSSAQNNWSWRLTSEQLASLDAAALRKLVQMYDRE